MYTYDLWIFNFFSKNITSVFKFEDEFEGVKNNGFNIKMNEKYLCLD